jgi:hypothetical protein
MSALTGTQGEYMTDPSPSKPKPVKLVKPKVTIRQVIEAIEADDNLGFCIACGAEAFNVEPDAREYECESCGEKKVYGAEGLLLMGIGI